MENLDFIETKDLSSEKVRDLKIVQNQKKFNLKNSKSIQEISHQSNF